MNHIDNNPSLITKKLKTFTNVLYIPKWSSQNCWWSVFFSHWHSDDIFTVSCADPKVNTDYPKKASCALNEISTYLLEFIGHGGLCFNSCMLLQFLQLKQYHVIIIVVFHVVLHFFFFSGRMLLVLTITMLVLTLGSAQLTVNISS
jgi:hypothetical protein